MAGRLEEAVSTFKKTIQRTPDNILPHLWLGGYIQFDGSKKEAVLRLKKSSG